jgi:hypothetical protein
VGTLVGLGTICYLTVETSLPLSAAPPIERPA